MPRKIASSRGMEYHLRRKHANAIASGEGLFGRDRSLRARFAQLAVPKPVIRTTTFVRKDGVQFFVPEGGLKPALLHSATQFVDVLAN